MPLPFSRNKENPGGLCEGFVKGIAPGVKEHNVLCDVCMGQCQRLRTKPHKCFQDTILV